MGCGGSKHGDVESATAAEVVAVEPSTKTAVHRGVIKTTNTSNTAANAPSMAIVKNRVPKKAPPDLKLVLGGVEQTTFELFGKLNAFNKNKQGFRAIIDSVDPDGLLCSIEVNAVGLFVGKQIKTQFYQRQVDGTPVQTIEELYYAAEAVLPRFQDFLRDVAKKKEGVNVKLAPLKGKDRAKQKGDSDYADRECPSGGLAIGWVFDIVRGTLLCSSADQIKAVVMLLVADKNKV
jgi:hypothetical protein